MATLQQIKAKFLKLQGREVELAVQALQESDERILSLNRQQLFDGKTSQGEDLFPTYFDDPYFKTKEAAERYSNWKDKITPNPNRKKGVPNLFIIGTFHNSIEVDVSNKGLSFSASFLGDKIVRKYGGEVFGLSKDRRIELNRTTQPLFMSKIYKALK